METNFPKFEVSPLIKNILDKADKAPQNLSTAVSTLVEYLNQYKEQIESFSCLDESQEKLEQQLKDLYVKLKKREEVIKKLNNVNFISSREQASALPSDLILQSPNHIPQLHSLPEISSDKQNEGDSMDPFISHSVPNIPIDNLLPESSNIP